jgi:DNA-binding NarL/FixJ family response regulator
MSEKIYVQEDGEMREATPEELAQIVADQQEAATRAAEELAKAEARTSALAKLAALGLTEEEIAAL